MYLIIMFNVLRLPTVTLKKKFGGTFEASPSLSVLSWIKMGQNFARILFEPLELLAQLILSYRGGCTVHSGSAHGPY